MSAEPRVLLKFDLPPFVEESRMRIVQVGDAMRLDVLDELDGWLPWREYATDSPEVEVAALAVYDAMRAKCEAECPSEATTPEQDRERDAQDQEQFGELFAMRAREVRE